jgi:5-methylcytosine-specific restriction endonuclease McrA
VARGPTVEVVPGLRLLREAHARGERRLEFSHPEGCTYEAPLEERHECFLKSGVVCAGCGLHASFFAWERQESGEWTLSLYGQREGADVYFTKDHIWPRSRGGANALDNYQTMCWPCNSRKGNAMG